MSALALARLQNDAFQASHREQSDEERESWRQEMIKKSPTFHFWDTILQLELLGLIFVRAHRVKDFTLYVESLKQIVPWFFAPDHQNYSRWIPVHTRDMESLPQPIFEEFKENGHWVVSKTMNRFSAMPIDQCHEQKQ